MHSAVRCSEKVGEGELLIHLCEDQKSNCESPRQTELSVKWRRRRKRADGTGKTGNFISGGQRGSVIRQHREETKRTEKLHLCWISVGRKETE